jgi:hypothetical protein
MKRTLALVLALLLLLPACSSNNPEEIAGETVSAEVSANEGTAEEAVPEETEYAPDLPDVKYDGEEFRVLYRTSSYAYATTDIFVEGLTGEITNDAVYNRNIEMEETYDFKFAPIAAEDPIYSVTADFMAASDSYDLTIEQMNSLFTYALRDYFYDWNTLEHFNPDDPWWDSNCAKDLSFANKLYIMAGDISMQPSNCARFIYYNKKVHEDYQLENPYELVRENKWTIDKMTEMVKSVSTDLNGDGKYTADDVLGMLTETADFFLSGCGILYTEKDENDLPIIDCINERTITALEKVKALLTAPNCTQSYNQVAAGRDTSGYPHIFVFARAEYFATDHFLFVQNGAGEAATFIEMDPGYGVLPNPKLDETQEQYYHLSDPYSCAWAIPGGNSKPEMTDVLLTAWAYKSKDLVDAYYETTLKHKRYNSPDDSEMLDLIRGSVRYEMSMLCDLGISGVISSAYSSGNLMSDYAKNEKRITKVMEKTFGDLIG